MYLVEGEFNVAEAKDVLSVEAKLLGDNWGRFTFLELLCSKQENRKRCNTEFQRRGQLKDFRFIRKVVSVNIIQKAILDSLTFCTWLAFSTSSNSDKTRSRSSIDRCTSSVLLKINVLLLMKINKTIQKLFYALKKLKINFCIAGILINYGSWFARHNFFTFSAIVFLLFRMSNLSKHFLAFNISLSYTPLHFFLYLFILLVEGSRFSLTVVSFQRTFLILKTFPVTVFLNNFDRNETISSFYLLCHPEWKNRFRNNTTSIIENRTDSCSSCT